MNIPLTNPNPEVTTLANKTPYGMAHWAGSGPAGAMCGGCSHWGDVVGPSGRKPWPERCKKFNVLTNKIGGRLDRLQPACRHHEPR